MLPSFISVNLFTYVSAFLLLLTFPYVLSERGLINKNLFEKQHQNPRLLPDESFVSVRPGAASDRPSDLTLLGTADGYLHAIDPSTSKKLWSTDIGGPMVSSYQSKATQDEGHHTTVVPNVDGTLLVHGTNEGMRKTSVKARMLAEKVSSMNTSFSSS